MYPNKAVKNNTPEVREQQIDQITEYGGDSGVDTKAVLKRIKDRYKKYAEECDKNFERAKENRKYATNNFDVEGEANLLAGESPIYVPKMRENMETVIPMATEKTPEPDIAVRMVKGICPKSKETNLKRLATSYLKEFWEMDAYMQKRTEQGLRLYFCQGFFCFKYLWNPDRKRAEFYVVPMGNLIIPLKDTRDPDNLPFIMEKVSDTYENIVKRFYTTTDDQGNSAIDQAKLDEFKRAIGKTVTNDTRFDFLEYWEREIVAWKYEDVLFDIQSNPNWNEYPNSKNHFEVPELPYIFENAYSFGDGIADDATAIEATKSIANNLNRTKRQIDLNLDDANGQMVMNGDYISDEDSNKIDRSRQNKVIAKSQDGTPVRLGEVLTFATSRTVGQEAFNSMKHDEDHMDNEWAAHDVTRGEQQMTQTATGQQVLKDGDKNKNSTLTRMIERVSQKSYNALFQMLYVYGDEGYTSFAPDADSSQMSTLNKEIVQDYVFKVQVKDGSTTPRNPAVLKAEIVDLAKNKMASLLDLYRDLEYDDPEGRAKRAVQEATDPGSLYGLDGNPDQYSATARLQLMGIIDGEIDPMQPYQIDDIKLFQAYLKTITDYLAGKEIDPDISSFLDLDQPTQQKIQAHVQMEMKLFQQEQQTQMQQAVMQKKVAEAAGLSQGPTPGGQPPSPTGPGSQVSPITGNTENNPLESSPQQAAVIAP